MPINAGNSAVALRMGSSTATLRRGPFGVLGKPDGLAVLSWSVAASTVTLVHNLAAANGAAVTYTYAFQGISGIPPLPVPFTPSTTSTGKQVVTITVAEYDGGYASYRVIVTATNSYGSTSATAELPATPNYPQTWPAESFPDHVQDQFAGLSATSAAAVFANDSRNEEAWFSGIPAPLSVSTTAKGGTLISPEHALFAAHYPPSVGDTYTWLNSNSEAVARTISALAVHPGYSSDTYRNDIVIARLSAPITEVPYAKTLPGDWRQYVPSSGNSYLRLPLLAYEINGSNIQEISAPLLESVSQAGFVVNLTDQTAALRPSIVSGDSGQPLFLLVNGEAALIGAWTGAFYGTFLPDEITEVNALMASLGGGYSLETIDLSGFAAIRPNAPAALDDPEALTPADGQLLFFWYAPQYAGSSPITTYRIYANGLLLPNASFSVSAVTDYGGTVFSAVITEGTGSLDGAELQVSAVNAAGESDLSSVVTAAL